jgi:hypothetical protein
MTGRLCDPEAGGRGGAEPTWESDVGCVSRTVERLSTLSPSARWLPHLYYCFRTIEALRARLLPPVPIRCRQSGGSVAVAERCLF